MDKWVRRIIKVEGANVEAVKVVVVVHRVVDKGEVKVVKGEADNPKDNEVMDSTKDKVADSTKGNEVVDSTKEVSQCCYLRIYAVIPIRAEPY